MSLMVMLLVLTLVAQCRTAPQRRNWTPQAILYLKGAQAHRPEVQRHSREQDAYQLLLQPVDQAGHRLDDFPDMDELNYF